jgi:large subunit ribosomal protein L13
MAVAAKKKQKAEKSEKVEKSERPEKALGFKTYMARAGELKRQWWVVNAEGRVLGRLASAIAVRLMGKDKPVYTPHLDTGDFVVVVNADKVQIDARKVRGKSYRRWSGFLGGLKERTYETMHEKKPEWVISEAVRKMLPKNLLAKQMLRKLKVYKGAKHPHSAQEPQEWKPRA